MSCGAPAGRRDRGQRRGGRLRGGDRRRRGGLRPGRRRRCWGCRRAVCWPAPAPARRRPRSALGGSVGAGGRPSAGAALGVLDVLGRRACRRPCRRAARRGAGACRPACRRRRGGGRRVGGGGQRGLRRDVGRDHGRAAACASAAWRRRAPATHRVAGARRRRRRRRGLRGGERGGRGRGGGRAGVGRRRWPCAARSAASWPAGWLARRCPSLGVGGVLGRRLGRVADASSAPGGGVGLGVVVVLPARGAAVVVTTARCPGRGGSCGLPQVRSGPWSGSGGRRSRRRMRRRAVGWRSCGAASTRALGGVMGRDDI